MTKKQIIELLKEKRDLCLKEAKLYKDKDFTFYTQMTERAYTLYLILEEIEMREEK